jgi:membrane protein YdbS with pleckstrin-like domain
LIFKRPKAKAAETTMKRCPFCAEEIQDAAVKCRFCNSMLTPQGAGQPAAAAVHDAFGLATNPTQPPYAAAPAPAPPPATTQDPAVRVLYDGTPSWRAWFWSFFATVVLVLGGVALGIFLAVAYEPIYSIGGGVLVLVGLVWYGILRLSLRSQRVRITTQTIDLESGVFGKTIHTLQLWRVHDIDFEQSVGERILGIARIHVLSQDQEKPKVTLVGLSATRTLFDQLKDAIAIARQAKNVLGVVS